MHSKRRHSPLERKATKSLEGEGQQAKYYNRLHKERNKKKRQKSQTKKLPEEGYLRIQIRGRKATTNKARGALLAAAGSSNETAAESEEDFSHFVVSTRSVTQKAAKVGGCSERERRAGRISLVGATVTATWLRN